MALLAWLDVNAAPQGYGHIDSRLEYLKREKAELELKKRKLKDEIRDKLEEAQRVLETLEEHEDKDEDDDDDEPQQRPIPIDVRAIETM